MKNLQKAEIAVIGGSGLEEIFESKKTLRIGTPYGLPSRIFLSEIDGRNVAFLPRHGKAHSVPPHKINYRANIYALHKLGVVRIIATNAVGAINEKFSPGDLVVPHDFVDFTKRRVPTFYESSPVTHVDFTFPYCPEIRETLISSARKLNVKVWDRAVLVCTEGPRFETPAEIEIFRKLGCDVVGMTGIPEAVLARELEICYASLCYVSNMAAGLQSKLSAVEVKRVIGNIFPVFEQVLRETVRTLPHVRKCPCKDALKDARYE